MEEDKPEFKYDIFLSHNSEDKPVVRQLAERLANSELQVWLDENELIPGQSWQEAIENALVEVKAVAVMIGPSGLGPWEKPEMRMALLQFVDKKVPVIPVLLPGTPQEVQLPLILRTLTWVDLRNGITDEGIFKIKCGIDRVRPNQAMDKYEIQKADKSLTRSLTIDERFYIKFGYVTFQIALKYLPKFLSWLLKSKKPNEAG